MKVILPKASETLSQDRKKWKIGEAAVFGVEGRTWRSDAKTGIPGIEAT